MKSSIKIFLHDIKYCGNIKIYFQLINDLHIIRWRVFL